MTTHFISRHPGAVDWACQQGIPIDQLHTHWHNVAIGPGDTVIGTLPLNLAAEVCARGARYLHLSLVLPASARGRELSAEELNQFGAKLEHYSIRKETP